VYSHRAGAEALSIVLIWGLVKRGKTGGGAHDCAITVRQYAALDQLVDGKYLTRDVKRKNRAMNQRRSDDGGEP